MAGQFGNWKFDRSNQAFIRGWESSLTSVTDAQASIGLKNIQMGWKLSTPPTIANFLERCGPDFEKARAKRAQDFGYDFIHEQREVNGVKALYQCAVKRTVPMPERIENLSFAQQKKRWRQLYQIAFGGNDSPLKGVTGLDVLEYQHIAARNEMRKALGWPLIHDPMEEL